MNEDTNILAIPHLRELFGCEVGLSDHTMGVVCGRSQRGVRRNDDRKALHRQPLRWRRGPHLLDEVR